jgi:IstB-like ATP binding protein
MKKLRDCFRLPAAPTALRARMSRDPAEKTWTCPTCGVILPLAFAEGWYARRPCRCEEAARVAREIAHLRAQTERARAVLTYTWLGRAWAEPGLAAKTFATFERERQPQAFDLAYAFAEQPQGTLACYGSFGIGKTHLLAAIANAQVERGHTCRFASAVSLFDALQERIQLGQDYHDLLRQAIRAPLLILDDVDKLKPSEFREETLYKLLNGRSVAACRWRSPRTTHPTHSCAGSGKPDARGSWLASSRCRCTGRITAWRGRHVEKSKGENTGRKHRA